MASSLTGRALGIALSAATGLLGATALAAPVTTEDLLNAEDNAAEWLMYGRDYRNQRFSPLDQITPDERRAAAAGLGVLDRRPVRRPRGDAAVPGRRALHLDRLFAGVRDRRRERQPALVVRARVPGGDRGKLCCGPVNRGVALKDELVFVNTLDARLYALSRADGRVVWQQTIDDWQKAVTATGAPLVVGDQVIVGIGGAEYGVRGYLKAYDAATGELRWQTYTIPGPGEPGNETWPGDTWMHGGATTWQTGAYDAETGTLFWGTGNPGPWNSDLARATISGAGRCSRSTRTPARSSGAISTRRTMPGTTTATTPRS